MDSLFYQLGKLSAFSSSSSSSGVGRVNSNPGRLPRQLAPLAAAMVIFGLTVVVFLVMPLTLAGYVVFALAVATMYDAVEIAQAYEKRTLTVFGGHKDILEPRLSVASPFVSKTYRFDMRAQTLDMPFQEAITEDSLPVTADAVVYIRVMGSGRVFLQADNYRRAVLPLAQATLRATFSDVELNDTLARRDHINARIHQELNEPTDEWGVCVESVEVRRVKPSKDVENVVEQQTSVECHCRAMILEVQGERRSAVEKTEGDKQLDIIHAQDEKRPQILEAQGDTTSTVLRARIAESMGGRTIVDKGIETLASIGTSPSMTYVLSQEPMSPFGRYGKGLSGSDMQQAMGLENKVFDRETCELLSLDGIGEILEELDNAETANIPAGAVDIEIENSSVE